MSPASYFNRPSIDWQPEIHVSPAQINWNRRNQRQKRKNRRRAHAAGHRKAFAA